MTAQEHMCLCACFLILSETSTSHAVPSHFFFYSPNRRSRLRALKLGHLGLGFKKKKKKGRTMNSKLPGPRSDKKGIEELVVWGRGERWVERSVQNSAASLLGEIFLDSMPGSLRQTVSLCSCLLAGAAAKVEAGEPQGHALHLFPLTKRGRGSRLRGGREGGKVRRTWTPCCCHRDTENWLRSSQEQTCTHTHLRAGQLQVKTEQFLRLISEESDGPGVSPVRSGHGCVMWHPPDADPDSLR